MFERIRADYLDFAIQLEAERMRNLMSMDLVAIGHMYPGRWQYIADIYRDNAWITAAYSTAIA